MGRKRIRENTSGVIIISYRDKLKNKQIDNKTQRSIFENFAQPVGSFYGNLFLIQDYNLDEMTQYLSDDLDYPVDVVDFELALIYLAQAIGLLE